VPPSAFTPGRFPHPFSDPAGHSYHSIRVQPPPPDDANWRASRAFLRGVDLFNHGFYWEAHEAWEGLWLACGRHGMMADFLKGLIHLAAAGVKYREAVPQGVTNHARRAADLWRGTGQGCLLGLQLAELITLAEAAEALGWPETPPLLLPGYHH
jgi:uncharacterized protein